VDLNFAQTPQVLTQTTDDIDTVVIDDPPFVTLLRQPNNAFLDAILLINIALAAL